MELIQTPSAATSPLWQFDKLKIVDKRSQLVPLTHNTAQLKVQNALEVQQRYGLPMRIIVLKARQTGISTFFEANLFEDITLRSNRHANVSSMDADSTDKVFEMCRTFYAELPESDKRPLRRSNRKEIVYAPPHRSGILCQTAGKDVLGRGGTTHRVHCTEIAFWQHARKQLLGLLNEVPNEPDTLVALESTACGDSGEFYERYWEAVKRLRKHPEAIDGFIPVFLPWQLFPEYRTPLPAYMKGRLELTADEPYLEVQHDEMYRKRGICLTPEQWYWRRGKIANACGMDLGLFKQEYPATAREAFQSTGLSVFSPVALDRHEASCCEPSARIEFLDKGYEHVLRGEDCWFVWKMPDPLRQYVVFGDVCEGLQSDPSDARSDPDSHACGILDRTTMEIVATFHGRCDTIHYGEQMYHAARFYNWAICTPEINSCGLAVLNELKRRNYPHIYSRLGGDEELVEKETVKLGYRTTSLNRKPGIEQLKKSLNNDEFKVYDRRIIDEMRSFAMVDGRPEAKVGYHDDWVMMMVGLLQVHLTAEMMEDEEIPNRTGGNMDEFKRNIAIVGEIDDLDDEDEEEAEESEDDDDVWK